MPSHSRSRYSEVHLSHSDISDNEGHRRSKMSKQTPSQYIGGSRYIQFLEIFERFLKEVDLSQLHNDDTMDFLTVKNIHKIFKLGKRRVIDHVVGKAGNESLGMPMFVECIYRMQHHWSPRVYEVAFLISNQFLVGYLGRQTPILTDLTSELVQYNMQEPEDD